MTTAAWVALIVVTVFTVIAIGCALLVAEIDRNERR